MKGVTYTGDYQIVDDYNPYYYTDKAPFGAEDERVVCFICKMTPEETDGEYGPMMSTLGGDACKTCAEDYGYEHPRDMIYMDSEVGPRSRDSTMGIPSRKEMVDKYLDGKDPEDYGTFGKDGLPDSEEGLKNLQNTYRNVLRQRNDPADREMMEKINQKLQRKYQPEPEYDWYRKMETEPMNMKGASGILMIVIGFILFKN